MQESKYRNEVFLLEMAVYHLKNLIGNKANEDQIKAAEVRLTENRQRLQQALNCSTDEERREISESLAATYDEDSSEWIKPNS